MNSTEQPAGGAPVEPTVRPSVEAEALRNLADHAKFEAAVMGACWPMGSDTDCEGALCALHTGKIAMFASRAAARKAIKVSTAYAKLRKAHGLPPNDDFLEGIANVRIVECESA